MKLKKDLIHNGTTEFVVKKRFLPGGAAGRIAIIILSVTILILTIVYISGVIKYSGKFLKNTNINGVDASELTAQEVEDQVALLIASYELRIRERNGEEEIIKGTDIDYQYISQGEIQGFLKEQNAFLWPFTNSKEKVHTFESSASYDQTALNELITDLICFKNESIQKPEDAHLQFENNQYVIAEEIMGNLLIQEDTVRYIVESVDYAREDISLDEAGLYQNPVVFKEDKELQTACESLNQYLKTELYMSFGKTEEILSPDIVKDWLSYDSQSGVTIDEKSIFSFVNQIADKYDTYGMERSFMTHRGTSVLVTGYEYGWEMEREATTKNVLQALQNGQQGEITVEYIHTARSHENGDVGDTYVEVDMGEQHVWMYVNGSLIIESDCVTGMAYDDSKRTPEGVYTLTYKESPSILRGENAEYETQVEYWMPFNGGIGLHDATWRYGVFGGDLYLYDGSHGCVNLPLEVAAVIYDYIYEGFPVVCYY